MKSARTYGQDENLVQRMKAIDKLLLWEDEAALLSLSTKNTPKTFPKIVPDTVPKIVPESVQNNSDHNSSDDSIVRVEVLGVFFASSILYFSKKFSILPNFCTTLKA